jgi:VanZ family protein
MLSWPAPLRQRRPWRVLLLGLMLVVSWFAFAPVRFDDDGLPLDKLRHVAAFAVLAWVAMVAWAGTPKLALRVAIGLLAYGLFIEAVQGRLDGRHASGWDLLADAVGVAFGLALARQFNPAR